MTRSQKNKKMYRKNLLDLVLDLIFKGLKWIIKTTIKSIVWLLVKVMVITYKLIKLINKLVAKGFNKLPRLMKVTIVYVLIGMSVIGVLSITNPKVKVETIVKEQIVEKVVAITENENQEQVVEEETTKTIDLGNENANNIYNKGLEMGLTHEQSLLIVSISQHETGHWTSKAFKENYNFGGVMCSTGLKNYDTYEEGLTHFVKVLKDYYFDLGLTTIEKIGAKYCPVGAENDPKGLNKNWVPSVTNIYTNYLESVK